MPENVAMPVQEVDAPDPSVEVEQVEEVVELTAREKKLKTVELIEAGECTPESIREALGLDKKGLTKLLSQVRMMEKYPMLNEQGVYYIGTYEDWEKNKATSPVAKAPKGRAPNFKNMQARRETKRKAVQTSGERMNNAEVKMLKAPGNYEHSTRFQIASLQYSLANYLYDKTVKIMAEDLNTTVDELSTIRDLDAYVEDLKAEGIIAGDDS